MPDANLATVNQLDTDCTFKEHWTPEQNDIIRTASNARILIDAGPGTGKTATACARISWLINDAGIEPNSIWLVSFTRTAIHELRNRISSYLKKPESASSIRISTIDSHCWSLFSGFDEDAKLTGSFDDNIKNTIRLIKENENLKEYMNNVEHLIIDEAQDIVGLRCELLLELINALPMPCGVSIFSDEAQSIYGFSEDTSENSVQGTLPENIREYMPDFRQCELNHVHRTEDRILREVFSNGRAILRSKQQENERRLDSIKKLIRSTNHNDLALYRDDIKALPPDLHDAFLLFRRRGDVLDASSYMNNRPHRIRMSGLPVCIYSWIAAIFWDWTQPEINLREFEDRWKERLGPTCHVDLPTAWKSLTRIAGRTETTIRMDTLTKRLDSASPPYELTLPEFGTSGPVLGTIHAAKGREAAEVRLYMPPPQQGETTSEKIEEEARILFVGATRAKARLGVGISAPKMVPRTLEKTGRAYTPHIYDSKTGRRTARSRIEIGRPGDIAAPGLAGRALYSTQQDVLEAQKRILALEGNLSAAETLHADKDRDWRYPLVTSSDKTFLCYIEPSVNTDLFKIARLIDNLVHLQKLAPPTWLNHLSLFGCRTLALAPDNPHRDKLHAPWCDSGILAAPMLLGYPFAYFREVPQ